MKPIWGETLRKTAESAAVRIRRNRTGFRRKFPRSAPIHLIVPFPPGGPNDIIARVVAQKMQDIIKQRS